MLINYKFQNFMSFRENAEFSMMAPKTKVKSRFPLNYTDTGYGTELLKAAVIVGENAGGKSNFVTSFVYLQSFFKETARVRSYKNMIHTNNSASFCPKDNTTLQSFDLEIFIAGSGFYQYHLEIDFIGLVQEDFYFKNHYSNKYKPVFSAGRKQQELRCHKQQKECASQCRPEAEINYFLSMPSVTPGIQSALLKAINTKNPLGLMITKLAVLGNEHAVHFTEWLKTCLCPETNMINYDIYKSMLLEEDDLRILHDPRYLDIFKMIDYSITGFTLDEENPFTKTLIVRKKQDGTSFSRELEQDSSGVREFFAWAVQIFKIVYEDKVVFADEMDRVLNPVLSDRVVSFVCGKQHKGQFIFTTHNVLHLNLKNYMKEQIFFITKDAETLESELYSLSDFPEIRYETSKIYEFYMKGILGGTAIE